MMPAPADPLLFTRSNSSCFDSAHSRHTIIQEGS